MTDLKLTCQTPHQYYDNSPHRFSDPACRLTALTELWGGRAGCGLAALGASGCLSLPVAPWCCAQQHRPVLSTTSNPLFAFPKAVKKQQPCFIGGDTRTSIL